MTEESERLAKALIEYRESEDISVREVALRAELSIATIHLFERNPGHPPTDFAARRFEEILGWEPGSIANTPDQTTSDEPSAEAGE